jgi:(2Fe-2S) ferredoxin
MSWYERHLFFCTNRRDDGRPCCYEAGAEPARAWAKARVKALGLAGPGKVRVNMAGCLDRCEEGPVAVVYPDGVWYTYVDQEDLEEIIQEHLVNGRVVERLQLKSEPPGGGG